MAARHVVSGRPLDAAQIRIQAADVPPRRTPGLSIFGRFELCEQPSSRYPRGLAGSQLLIEEAVDADSPDALGGVFDRLRTIRGVVPNPGERETASVLVVLVDNLAPTRDEDFNRWYDEVHVPDILSAGSFHRATRFRARGSSPLDSQLAEFLAVYETDWDDALAALQTMASRPNPGSLWDELNAVHLAVYCRQRPEECPQPLK
jgi:hypothetical protein